MATITITTTTQQDARIVVAFGSRLSLGRNATAPEVKAEVIDFIRRVVRDYEGGIAATAAIVAVSPLDPT